MKTLAAYSVLAGLTLWLGFDWPNLLLLMVGLVGLHWLILRQVKSWAEALLAGWVAGTVFSLGFLAWHWTVLPLDWAGVTSRFAGPLLVFYVWSLPSVLIGMTVSAWALIIFKLKNRSIWLIIFLSPLLWVIFEWLRSVGLSLLWLGNGGTAGPIWTLGFLGYALAAWPPLLWWAQFGGVYILSFIAVLAAALVYARRPLALFLAGAAILAAPALWPVPVAPRAVTVAVTTMRLSSFSRLSPAETAAIKARELKLIAAVDAIKPPPAVAIFPEDTRIKTFAGALPRRSVTIIDSARVISADGRADLTFFYTDNSTGAVATTGKQFLVPHGEYIPYLTDLLGGVIGQSAWVKSFRSARGTAKSSQSRLVKINSLSLEATACDEIMLPARYAVEASRGASFLINAASHSLFRGSRQLYGQTLRMAQVRAAESGRALVESSNFVPSFLVAPSGAVLWQSRWGEERVDLVQIPIATGTTFYSRLAALFSRPVVLK